MRKSWLLLLLAPSALIYACGGDNNNTDGGTDATTDVTQPDSSNKDAASQDGGGQDAPSDVTQQPDVSINITCLKPADCFDGGGDAAFPPDSGEVCCGNVTTAGQFPQCSIVGADTACKAPSACPTQFQQSCGSDQARLCESNSECTEQTYNVCCSANVGDAGAIHICFNKQLSNFTGGKIVCP